MKKYNVAVVGATGLVGSTFLKVLEEYHFPINELRLVASRRSKGKEIIYDGKSYIVEELTKDLFTHIDIALFSAGASVAKEFAPYAVKSGALVIDNSSGFREYDDIPLVVPEVNPKDIVSRGIIANPNCSTIQSVLPLKALDDAFGVNKVEYTTYQAVSGSGMKGKNDLKRCLNNEKNEFYPYDISKTCIPEIDVFLDNGYTKEEMKMVKETRKILHKPNLLVSATCVRVPVENSHAVSIAVELDKEFSLDEVRKVLENYPGIVLVDKPNEHLYPVSTMANGNDLVYVGRIRKNIATVNGLLLYTVGDNIRKGAASNAVQIAKYVIEHNML